MTALYDTIVVGAGISGLVYAHARVARDPAARLLVLEESARAGGLVRTRHGGPEGEYRFECGPEALPTGSDETDALFRELGIELRQSGAAAKKRFLARGGRLLEVPASPRALLSSPLLGWRGKLRLLCERWRASRKALDGSIADFARHRLGREALATLVDPMVSGILAGDPEALSLRAAFPELARMVEEHKSLSAALGARRRAGHGAPGLAKPAAGLEELPRALASALGDRLRLSAPVQGLARTEQGFRIAARDGALMARRVVLAVPVQATARLLADVAPVPARALASMSSESLAVLVHAYPRERVAAPLDGFGYLVPGCERQHQLGTLFSSSLDPGCAPASRVLLRTMLGGARHPESVELSDDELRAIVAAEAGPLLGLDGPPVWSTVERYPRTLPRYDLEHPERQTLLESSLPANLAVLGNFRAGVGLATLIPSARRLARAHAEDAAERAPRR